MISVVVLTYNREHLLRKCVERVLSRTTDATREIVIWNNASTDGTRAFLASLKDPRIRVIDHEENIGQNGYARAFALTTQPYMVELDDDVTDAPDKWDATLLDAFRKLPKIGFLAANLVDDPNDVASRTMHHERPHEYAHVVENGLKLMKGPVGGGCTMTSRELYDRVGGFRQKPGQVFFLEDQEYVRDIQKLGYEAAFLEELRVHHTGGPYYAAFSAEKQAYWDAYAKRQARKDAVKRVLLSIPGVGALNTRLQLFQPPESGKAAQS